MPIIFYHSVDLGLLERKIVEFQTSYPKSKIHRNVSFDDLDLLFSADLFNLHQESLDLVLFVSSKDLINIASILKSMNVNLLNVLILCNEEFLKIPQDFLSFVSNSNHRIDRLTNVTKKGFINGLVSASPYIFKKEIIDLIKSQIPPNVFFIDTIFQNITDLKRINALTLDSVRELLAGMKQEANYFDFFYKYLSNTNALWIAFIDENIKTQEEYNKFFYSLGFKILEFKRFLSVKEEFKTSDQIAFRLKVSKHIPSNYLNLLNVFGEKLIVWFEQFVLNFYFFEKTLIHSISVNVSLIKLFLLNEKHRLVYGWK